MIFWKFFIESFFKFLFSKNLNLKSLLDQPAVVGEKSKAVERYIHDVVPFYLCSITFIRFNSQFYSNLCWLVVAVTAFAFMCHRLNARFVKHLLWFCCTLLDFQTDLIFPQLLLSLLVLFVAANIQDTKILKKLLYIMCSRVHHSQTQHTETYINLSTHTPMLSFPFNINLITGLSTHRFKLNPLKKLCSYCIGTCRLACFVVRTYKIYWLKMNSHCTVLTVFVDAALP